MADLPTLATAFLIGTALVAGLARGFSGFGAALIFMPVASAIIGARLAAAGFLLADVLLSLALVPGALKHARSREVCFLWLGAVPATYLGSTVLLLTEATTLRWIIVGLAAIMLAILLSGWRYAGEPRPWTTVVVGAFSGLGSGAAQIGGPPLVAYLLGGGRSPIDMRATINLFFGGMTVCALLVFFWQGLMTREAFHYGLIVAPLYGLGIWLGSRLFQAAHEGLYRKACLALIALSLVLSLPIWT